MSRVGFVASLHVGSAQTPQRKKKTKKQKKEVNTNPSVGEFENSGTGGCPA